MSKFLKGCLITACVSIILGIIILAGVAISGRGNEVIDAVENGGIVWDEDGFSVGSTVVVDTAILGNEAAMEQALEKGNQYTYPVDKVEKLQMELEAGKFEILTGDGEEIYIRTSKKVKVSNDGDCIEIETPDRLMIFGFGKTDVQSVEITLPKDHKFHTMEIEIDAGELDADSLTAENIGLDIGAGRMTVNRLEVKNTDINVGAGEVIIESGNIGTMDLDVGMGSFQMKGNITDDLDADCGMGNMDMSLLGQYVDHDYEVDCGMGSVRIGDMTYSGMSSGQNVDNNTDSEFDLDCGMGSINISFEK